MLTPGQELVKNIAMYEDTHLLNEVVVTSGKKVRYQKQG
jgi:hypothetical protein